MLEKLGHTIVPPVGSLVPLVEKGYDCKQMQGLALKNVQVTQTGCIVVCRLEPIVEVYVPGQEKVTYVKMTPEKVPEVIREYALKEGLAQ